MKQASKTGSLQTMIDTQTAPPRFTWLASPMTKLGLILLLTLLLQIPLLAVSSLIGERQDRQDEVTASIGRSWGPAQTITAPTLAVPYNWTEPATNLAPAQSHHGWIQVPPRDVAIHAQLAPETRRRGLFRATVYTGAVQVDGTLAIPAIDLQTMPGAELLWNEAVIAIGATGLRGQPRGGTMTVAGQALPFSVSSRGDLCGSAASLAAGLAGRPQPGTVLPFSTRLSVRGTQSFAVAPWGGHTDLTVEAPWQTPSFNGGALPLSYDISRAGFHADWQIDGDATTSNWRIASAPLPTCDIAGAGTDVGVDLLEAVPTYLMVTRTAKYGTLFLVLCFLTYFLIEQGVAVRIHLAQYGLLGLSVVLFPLLLLAVAEPLGFTAAYGISTVAVMAQASLYTWSVTGRVRASLLFAGVLGTLFAVLFVILRLETYALLTGTAVLFLVLSVIMATTRRLDWSGRAVRQD